MNNKRLTPEFLEATANQMLKLADEIEQLPLPDPSQAESVAGAIQYHREKAHELLAAVAALRSGEAEFIA